MKIICINCKSELVKKNGLTHNKKQNYKCLECGKQFTEENKQKLISEETKKLVRKTLLERVSLHGICRIFDISMPWLLDFITKIISELPENLNAKLVSPDSEFDMVILEADELWSFVQKKTNKQWLWLILHKDTRQILAMHVGNRDEQSAQILLAKLPDYLKKKLTFTQINLLLIKMLYQELNTALSQKALVKHLILKDLIIPLDNDVLD